MCILFAYINNDAKEGEFQLVLANNRDEFFDRSTAPAARWQHNPACISGVDTKPEMPPGGTWLGLSTATRKIASLLNIVLVGNPDPTMKGRGCLVSNFISSDVTGEKYADELKEHAKDYNPFNLLLIEQSADEKWRAHYYSADEEASPHPITDKVFGLSNSPYSTPWQKVERGKEQFAALVSQHTSVTSKDALTTALIGFLSDTTQHLPDPHLEAHTPTNLPIDRTKFNQACSAISVQLPMCSYGSRHLPDPHLEQHFSPGMGVERQTLNERRSGICVRMPTVRYGTRTNTVILVDSKGQGHYVERTMAEPINAENPQWSTSSIRFTMGESL